MHLHRTSRLAAAFVAGLLLMCCAGVARAEVTAASSVVVDGAVAADGTLSISQVITLDAAPDQVVQRLATKQRIDDVSHYAFDISNVTAQVGGATVEPRVTTEGDYVVVTVDTSAASDSEVVIAYDVVGATRLEESSAGGLAVVSWRVLQGLSVGADEVSGTLRVPAVPELVDCTAGPPGTPDKCDMYAAGTTQSPMPNFQTSARGAGEQVSLTVGVAADAVLPTAVVVEKWSLDRAFAVTPLTVAVALGALVLGAALIWHLHRRTGVDAVHAPFTGPAGTFRPVGAGESVFETELLPGLVGTVADERVDPLDITATVLDLAVRHHLRITELPRPGHGLLDWSFCRTSRAGGELLGYERTILDAVAPVGGTTLVSALPTTLGPVVGDVQGALYDEVVRRGWFEARPDDTRSTWRTRGAVGMGVAVVLCVVLTTLTNLGLLALVLLALAASLLWVADRMPRRSARGAALLVGLDALASLLATHPTTEMPHGRELREISRVLPFAVVLGGKDRWLAAMVAADPDDDQPDPTTIDWYHAPATWRLQDLPASLTQFIHTVQGTLLAR